MEPIDNSTDTRTDETVAGKSAKEPDHLRTFLVVVDDSAEMRAALAYACLRARVTHGQVALLRVIEPSAVQHFAFVKKAFESQTREEAEQLLQRMAGEVNSRSGHFPSLYVREGRAEDELMALLREEPNISVLVLAVATDRHGPGPLVTSMGAGLSAKLPVPVTLVPGHLSDEDIERMG